MQNSEHSLRLADEIELKFAVSELDSGRIGMRLPGPERNRKAKTRKHLRSVYYDTSELDLRRRGIGLRVRHVNGRRLQTVKCDGRPGSSIGRLECEHEIKSNGPDLTCIDEAGLRDLFAEIGAPEQLKPLFTTEIDRTIWEFEQDGAAIECAYDVGKIKANGRSLPVRELELELKGGHRAGLFQAADALVHALPLRVEWQSKGTRGFGLLQKDALDPPRPPTLSPKMTVLEALLAISGYCIDGIAFHASFVRQRGEIKDIHGMRVAVRRFRAVLSTFTRAQGSKKLQFERDLRWLQDKLGVVRDWDVLLQDGIAATLKETGKAIPVEDASIAARAEAYDDLCMALNSARCTVLWVAIARWQSDPLLDQQSGNTPNQSALKYARRELRRRAKKLDKRGDNITKLDGPDLHKLRIDAKKLRYASEFLSALLSKKRTKRILARLKALQDLLGRMNDARTAEKLLGKLVEGQNGAAASPLALGSGLVEGTVLARSRVDRKRLEKHWRSYASVRKVWS